MPEQIPCQYKSLQYGEFDFKGFVKTSLNSQVVYAEDGTTAKYVRYTLEAQLIIAKDLVNTAGMYGPTYGENANLDLDSVDVSMDRIRYQLSRPNCRLVFWHHGAGIAVNVLGQNESDDAEDFDYKYNNHVHYNTLAGPFPEILQWEPLGLNNSVRCTWRCNFHLPVNNTIQAAAFVDDADVFDKSRERAGIRTIGSIIQDYMAYAIYKDPNVASKIGGELGSATLANYVLAVSEEHEYEVSEEGTIVSTLSGVVEFSGSGTTFLNSTGDVSAVPRLIQALVHYFEPLHPTGFTRTQKYKLRKNRRELEYVIVDREIPSDNPLMPNIIKADVTHSVASELLSDNIMQGSGFLTWANNFEGNITVAPGKWKGWAWIAFMCIVQQRMLRTAPVTVENVASVKNQLSPSKKAPTEDDRVHARNMLTKISIKEHIYTRQVSFSVSYLVISDLAQLFDNTGLFEPVHISWKPQTLPAQFGQVKVDYIKRGIDATGEDNFAHTYEDQWQQSREFMANSQNVFGYRGPLMPGYNVVFNPYTEFDPNRQNLSVPLPNQQPKNFKNPEAYYPKDGNGVPQVPGGGTVDAGPYNVHQFAQHRRNTHLETFKDLKFKFGSIDPGVVAGVGVTILNNVAGRPALPPSYEYNQAPPDGLQYATYKGADATTPWWLRNTKSECTWLKYDINFELIRNENAAMLPQIGASTMASRHETNSRPEAIKRGHKGFSILGASNSAFNNNIPEYNYQAFCAFGLPVTYLRCSGSAMRIGFPIATPTLVGIQRFGEESPGPADGISGNQLVKAFRVGTSAWTHKMVSQSADMPVFAATWDIMYALQGDPKCDNIGFRTTQPSEYA